VNLPFSQAPYLFALGDWKLQCGQTSLRGRPGNESFVNQHLSSMPSAIRPGPSPMATHGPRRF
jgi:hypothetical protein